jgi:hypothetical protein
MLGFNPSKIVNRNSTREQQNTDQIKRSSYTAEVATQKSFMQRKRAPNAVCVKRNGRPCSLGGVFGINVACNGYRLTPDFNVHQVTLRVWTFGRGFTVPTSKKSEHPRHRVPTSKKSEHPR